MSKHGSVKIKAVVRFNSNIFEDIVRICKSIAPDKRDLVVVGLQDKPLRGNGALNSGERAVVQRSASIAGKSRGPPEPYLKSKGRRIKRKLDVANKTITETSSENINDAEDGQVLPGSPPKNQSMTADKPENEDGCKSPISANGEKSAIDAEEEEDGNSESESKPSPGTLPKRSSNRLKRRECISNHLGLNNPGLLCYMNASLQVLAAAEPFRSYLINAEVTKQENKLVFHISKVISEIQSNQPIEEKDVDDQLEFLKAYNEFRHLLPNDTQHDAHEYITKMLEHLEIRLKKYRNCDIYNDLFSFTSTMLPSFCEGNCKKNVTPTEAAMHQVMLTLDLPGPKDVFKTVQNLIDESMQTEFVERCCGTSVTTHSIFSKLPEVLIVCLKRYNAEGKKIKVRVEASTDLVLAEHTFKEKDKKLFKSNDDSENKDNLLGHKIRKYQLVGMVNHLGHTVRSGHYIAVVYNNTEDVWIKADDDKITLVDMSKIIVESANTCYILVYVALDEVDNANAIGETSESSTMISAESAESSEEEAVDKKSPEKEVADMAVSDEEGEESAEEEAVDKKLSEKEVVDTDTSDEEGVESAEEELVDKKGSSEEEQVAENEDLEVTQEEEDSDEFKSPDEGSDDEKENEHPV